MWKIFTEVLSLKSRISPNLASDMRDVVTKSVASFTSKSTILVGCERLDSIPMGVVIITKKSHS